MMNDFTESNNLPLLDYDGQIGHRADGGKNHGAPRYVYVKLHKISRFIFPKEDDELLKRVELEGKVDAIVFTAGIGENGISLRANVVNDISRALDIKLNKEANSNIARFKKNQSGIISTSDSKIKVLVIPTNEEYMILKDTYEISQKVKSNEFVKKLKKGN